LWHDELFRAKFRHKCMGKCRMLESVRCDHCEEDFAPEELTVLAPPAGDGELICARCIEIMLRRAIAKLPSEN
jgi:formylmethanofuran dehydrogenase subunit E